MTDSYGEGTICDGQTDTVRRTDRKMDNYGKNYIFPGGLGLGRDINIAFFTF